MPLWLTLCASAASGVAAPLQALDFENCFDTVNLRLLQAPFPKVWFSTSPFSLDKLFAASVRSTGGGDVKLLLLRHRLLQLTNASSNAQKRKMSLVQGKADAPSSEAAFLEAQHVAL